MIFNYTSAGSRSKDLLPVTVSQVFTGIFTPDAEPVSYTARTMRIYMAGIFAFDLQIACQQSFLALSQAKVSLLACLRKIILPQFMADKVFAVFLAKPVSDIIAASVTTAVFLSRFNKILQKGPNR